MCCLSGGGSTLEDEFCAFVDCGEGRGAVEEQEPFEVVQHQQVGVLPAAVLA